MSVKIINQEVGSSGIADGSIVNADVSASAAIAGTKISPAFGGQTITGSGSSIVGTESGVAIGLRQTGGAVEVSRSSASSNAFRSAVDGDTINRFGALADGKLEWGSGSLAKDTNLYRSAANELATDDDLRAGSGDTDSRMYVGTLADDYAGILNAQHWATKTTNYALYHSSGGATALNCVSGQTILFRVANVTKASLASDGAFVTTGRRKALTAVKTSAYTAVEGVDHVIRCDPSGGTFTVTLPATHTAGTEFVIKNVTSSTNVITIDPADADTVDGAASITITSAYGVARVISDGTNWFTI